MEFKDLKICVERRKTERNMAGNPDKNKNKFPAIKPKIGSSNEEIVMSKIHILKNWKLPPSPSYGVSGRKHKSPRNENTSVSKNEKLLLKKKRQNRDAQKAYRERKEKRLKEMESIIDTLQDQVKYWKKLYHSKCSEMSDLEKQYDQMRKERQNTTQLNQSALYGIISNFKPLKPVPLLPTTNKIFKGASSPRLSSTSNTAGKELFLSQTSHKLSKTSNIQIDTVYNQQSDHIRGIHEQTKDNDTNSGITSTNCGFCDGSSSCICDELTGNTTQKHPKTIISTKDTISMLALSQISDPMAIAQLACSSDPHNCTKCPDINETCIKSAVAYSTNNGDANAISSEIDFTDYK